MSGNFKPDDGSMQWLDEMAMSRIRKRQNQPLPPQQNSNNFHANGQQRQQLVIPEQQHQRRNHPILDRPVNPQQNLNVMSGRGVSLLPGETLANVMESIKQAKEFAEKTYMRTPHTVGPLYASGAKYLKEKGADAASLRKLSETTSVNTDVEKLSGRIQNVILGRFGEGDSQDRILSHMQPGMRMQVSQKMQLLQEGTWVAPNTLFTRPGQQQQQTSMNGPLPQSNQVQQQGPQTCKILTGYPAFRQVQTQGFGTTIPLAQAMGQIPAQLSGVDFIVRETVRAYIVQPNERVNLTAVQANPQMLVELVVLQAPPMTNIGMILVPKEAVANGMGGGRQIIMDGRQRVLQPNQQYMHNQNAMRQQNPGVTNHQQPQMIMANYNRPTQNGKILKG